ncbi:MAG: EAL domain-containing protein [Clostridia bacterium]|nr:EAL domain-containing protein [Clostridia bacterium]
MRSLRKSTLILTLLAVACIVVLLVAIIINVHGLSMSAERSTNSYLRDVARQSAQVIEERLNGLVNSLRIIGDSMAHRDPQDVVGNEEFLSRKRNTSEFDALAYVSINGRALMVDEDGHFSTSDAILDRYAHSEALAETLSGKTTAGFYGDYIAFMDPIYDGDEISGVMIGVRAKTRLQNMLVNDAFDGRGFTFIIDQYGDILVRPMADDTLAGISGFLNQAVNDFAAEAEAQRNAGEEVNALDITLDTDQGTAMLLDYQALDLFDWAVVTMVAEDFLSHEVGMYMTNIVITLVVLMVIFMVMFIVLIFMQNRYQNRLESVAFADSLTGGMSLIRFQMLAEPRIQKDPEGAYALVTLNVKRFKMINRLGGSHEGDDLLRRIYRVLEENLIDDSELVAHDMADNFILLLRNNDEAELRERLGNIADDIGSISTVLPVHTSQGVYVANDADVDMIAFMDRANMARMSKADDYHSSLVFYDDDFVKQQEERVRLIGMIEQGLENDEFLVYLQPKVSPTEKRVIGAEALVRWKHPEQGMIGPNIFIPLCEQNDLIGELDEYVFEKVCKQIAEWQKKGWDPGVISVNVSGLQLKDIDFIKRYRAIADKYGVDPSMIELELTESVMFSDTEIIEAKNVLDKIHEYGFRCSMDDFGSGYSALGLLQELPIDCLKLDRSFFTGVVDNRRAQIIIEMIIRLAKRLHIHTVAEGIETDKQFAILRNMGCDMIQGFFFSPPLPMDEYADMVFVKGEIYNKKGTSNRGH